MNDLIWLILLILLLPFGYVIFSGAPFVPTKEGDLKKLLNKLKIKPGSRLLDMGSGDGRVLRTASRDFGMKSVGWEINPYLVIISWLFSWRVSPRPKTKWVRMWRRPITPGTEFIYMFIIPRYAERARQKIENEVTWPATVISYEFELTGLELMRKYGSYYVYRLNHLENHAKRK